VAVRYFAAQRDKVELISYQTMEWPPTESEIRALPRREHALLEYKRQWYDLSSKQGKAEFVKDVLAMANTTAPMPLVT
jgi:hypothetical protein